MKYHLYCFIIFFFSFFFFFFFLSYTFALTSISEAFCGYRNVMLGLISLFSAPHINLVVKVWGEVGLHFRFKSC
jgi:hypothetical protein